MAIAGCGSHQAVSSMKGRILMHFEKQKSQYWGFILTDASVQSNSLHCSHCNLREKYMLPFFLSSKNNSCSWPMKWFAVNHGIQLFWEMFLRGVWELQVHSVPPGKSNSSFRVLPQTLDLVLASHQERLGESICKLCRSLSFIQP